MINKLKDYIEDNNVEWHYRMNGKEEDVLIFPYTFQLCDFVKLFNPDIFDEDGIECVLKDGYVAIWMNDICEYYNVELSDIFNKEEEQK